ncbi:hypothetical protein EZV62_024398 [Acer yangbiense]|uniref:CCHC-type domain-containing protein n=1 Tax=Acer yangbiense TaxID=1000413 RepID=A0A5C7GV13_9ROSI|nr:hypothetical protein EZV62_024398 [Acer yangbiense]
MVLTIMNAEEIASLCNTFSIEEKERHVRVLDGSMKDKGSQQLSLYLVGKIMATKLVNRGVFINVISKIWRVNGGVEIKPLEEEIGIFLRKMIREDYCFKCGRLGHTMRECLDDKEDRDVKSEESIRLCLWLRTTSPLKRSFFGGRGLTNVTGKDLKGNQQLSREMETERCLDSGVVRMVPDKECKVSNGKVFPSKLNGDSPTATINVKGKKVGSGLDNGHGAPNPNQKNLRKLPKHMRRLKNLRHLYLNGCNKLSEMPPKIGQITCLKTLTRFIVGKKRGYHLDELKDLNLGGTLRIDHLQRVENPRDAKEANLVGERNLLKLSLSWRNDSDLQSQEDVEKVLEALKPHANLKQLDISGYKGAQFSSWMRDNILYSVVRIELSDSDKCSKLPPLALLPCLRTLDLCNMSQVMYIDDHFQGGGTTIGFPSLQSLKIYNLPSLQRFSREDGRELLPCLTLLEISGSPKLTLPHLPSVEELRVCNCNEVIRGSISNLKNLVSLEVSNNDELNYLPDGMLLNLTSLKKLIVNNFKKLKCLPTEIVSLTSLERLDIQKCNELESFPGQGMEGLKCLKCLYLYWCRKFTSLTEGLQHLSCLQTLSLHSCPALVALPDGMKYLTSLRNLVLSGGFDSKLEVLPETLRYVPALQSLSISYYSNLASLPHWLGDLTSLQTLEIIHCPKLSSLPARIQGLTMLQILVIRGCPELEKRSEKEKGEDWYKIAHIPNIADRLYLEPVSDAT